jgi:PadR family transcriptional regulator, regulatory protein PadR
MGSGTAASESRASRFGLAPPRRFVLPAVLLLLSERPGYGYGLVPRLNEFRFGHVDRPAVYRALAQLERDGLVEASSQSPKAGQARRVYQVTPLGQQVLRVWMSVIKEEHDYLGNVLRRYQATGTTDAVLAEVEGGWAAALGVGWSPVSSTSVGRKGSALVESDLGYPAPEIEDLAGDELSDDGQAEDGQSDSWLDEEPQTNLFELDRDRSAVLIEVRSSVGPLSFGATSLRGSIEAAVVGGVFHTGVAPSGSLEIDVSALRSGNSLYDAELLRRIDARRFPTARVELRECTASRLGSRYGLKGDLTFHGVTRPAEGTVSVEALSDHRLLITGEQVFDIRDFAVPSPTMLMLRIYPDVRVRLQAEAELEEAP